jgi:hypothetical protein
LTERRRNGLLFADAKAAAEIAAGKIKKVRWCDTGFLSVFDSVPKTSYTVPGTAKRGVATVSTTAWTQDAPEIHV